jgi:Holliday junction resolvase
MLESKIQKDLIAKLKKEGYYVIKLIITNCPGIPDIIAIPPNSDVEFYEVKGPTGKLKPMQVFRINELTKHGVKAELYKPI